MVTVTVTQAAPFHLIADSTDGSPLRIRRTIAGDAWDRAEAESCEIPRPWRRAVGGGRTRRHRPALTGLPSLRLVAGSTTLPIYDADADADAADGER